LLHNFEYFVNFVEIHIFEIYEFLYAYFIYLTKQPTKILNFISFEKINKFINDCIAPNILNNDFIIFIVLKNRNNNHRSTQIYFYQNLS
jgi:hypothetical protein